MNGTVRRSLELPADRRLPRWVNLLIVVAAVLAGLAVGWLTVRGPGTALLAAGIFGAVAALAIYMKVELGLLLLIFISYNRFSDVLVQYHGLPSIAKALVGLLAVTLVARWLILGEEIKGIRRPLMMMGAYGLITFISLLYVPDFGQAQSMLLDYVDDAAITLMVAVLFQRGGYVKHAIWALILSGLFMAAISVFQYLTGTFDNEYWGFGNAPVMNIVGGSDEPRIAGPFGSPNAFAQVLVVIVPLAFDRLVHERSRLLKLLAGAAFVLCSLGVVFTFSRGAFIALSVVGLLLLVQYRPPLPWLLAGALAVAAILPLLPPQYTDRISTLTEILPGSQKVPVTDASFRGRTSEYLVGMMMFVDHPILGVGVNNFTNSYLQYARQLGIDQRGQERGAHSLYIQIAAEQGLLGILVFGLILFKVYQSLNEARQGFKALGKRDLAYLCLALMVGVTGYLTSSLFIHLSYPRMFWLIVGLSLAMPTAVEYARERMSRARL